ncbi:beta-ketoacyl synthase chain length factor [Aggregatibacter kilianii]|uniref:beta-ketoacyl synthase chain length factor n=1 Tax=Aggregatibacter kilianii TaxID=2025884 RepID=UPI000D6516F3|nr:beta-ketoacyl synthase chain length factor [Aggregatibacter kilianii]
MTQTICQFSFNIADWKIVCNKQLSADDWKSGYAHWQQNQANFADFAPKLAFLPPLKRRRLSDSARLFFEAAWDLVEEQSNLPVVYASGNSEINRNFALWYSLLTEGDVSPTSFSLSVHNALIGQWSELRQVKAETTSLTANKDNLEVALLEAYLLLKEGAQKVLVVIAESPLEQRYNVYPVVRQPFSYALALVVEAGEQYQLSLTNPVPENVDILDTALEWVKNQHLNCSQWQTPNNTGGTWLWQKS